MKVSIFFIIKLIIISLLELVNSELRLVFEMFRHGARAPGGCLDKKNTDMFGEKWSGDSELTAIGVRQHFLLGQRNRIRYSGFLSSSYQPNEVYVTSTDSNRTIMSAYSQLQGLFPPGTGPILYQNQTSIAVPPVIYNFTDEQINLGFNSLPNQLQVIPIHILNKKDHNFYLHDANVCPPVAQYIHANEGKQIVLNFMARLNATYGSVIKKALNLPNDDFFFNYDKVSRLFDAFIAGYTDQRELKVLRDAGLNLDEFSKMTYEFLALDGYDVNFGDKDNYIGRMSMSPTFLSLLNWMQTRISYDIIGKGYQGYDSPKLIMYSGHDSNLAAMQSYLKQIFNLTNYTYTPYASNLWFELHKNETALTNHSQFTENDYFIKVIFNDVQILGDFIPFKEFKYKIQTFSVGMDEINTFCKFQIAKNDLEISSQYTLYLTTTIILGIMSIVLLSYIVYLCYKKNEVYRQLDNPNLSNFQNIL